MKKFKFKEHTVLAEEHSGVYAFLINYKGRNIVYKTTDKTLYDDVDGNQRRSHAARAFVYEKVKSIYYGGVNNDIVVGATYECIKDVVEDGDSEKSFYYKKGKKYRSEQSGCLTDEFGVISHSWPSQDFDGYFKMIENG